MSEPLAALGDEDVVEYAIRMIAATEGIDRQAPRSLLNDQVLKRGLALSVLAKSPRPEADILVREIISRGDLNDVGGICESWLSSLDPNRWEKLRGISNLKAVDEASGHWISQTLKHLSDEGEANAGDLLKMLSP